MTIQRNGDIRLPTDGKSEIKTTYFKNKKREEEEPYDYMIKIIIIGDSGVGKTNIISRYCAKSGQQRAQFREHHVATIGVDFSIKNIQVDNKRIKLQIWDTAGQERFKTITETYYKGAAGIILAYSVGSEESFKSIQKWIGQVNGRTEEGVLKILVANKIDLNQNSSDEINEQILQNHRKITTEEGLLLAKRNGMRYFEASAKNNEGIQQIFQSLAKSIKQKIEEQEIVKNENVDVSRSITLDSSLLRQSTKTKSNGIEYSVRNSSFTQRIKSKICSC